MNNLGLPYELWLVVFENMDIPDVEACTKTCWYFRIVAHDSRLAYTRFHKAVQWLDQRYESRPTQFDLYRQRILITPFQLSPESRPGHLELIKEMQMSMKRDAVRRGLERRATEQASRFGAMVDHYYCPQVVARQRELELNHKRDKLERFLGSSQRPTLERAIELGVVMPSAADQTYQQFDVQRLTRLFAHWINHPIVKQRTKVPPPRAMVYKMRKQFESSYNTDIHRATRPKLKKQLTGITFGTVSSLRQQFIQLSA